MLFMLYDCKCFMYVMYFILCYMYLPITLNGYICAVNKILFYSILFYSIHFHKGTRQLTEETTKTVESITQDRMDWIILFVLICC